MSNATSEIIKAEQIRIKDGPSNMALWGALIKRNPNNLPIFCLSYQEKPATISAEIMSITYDETRFQFLRVVCRINRLLNRKDFYHEKIKEGAEITVYYSLEHHQGYVE